MIKMYLRTVLTFKIENVNETPWGSGVSTSTVSNLNEGPFASVKERRSRLLVRACPYVYVDVSYESAAVMVAMGVNDDGYRLAMGPPRASPSQLSTDRDSSHG